MPIRAAGSVGRHVATALAEALLIVGILGLIGFAAAPQVGGDPWFAGQADAGRAKAWLSLEDGARLSDSADGTRYTVVGGNFDPDVSVAINLAEPGCCRFFSVNPDADGGIAFTTETVDPGTYEVRAYQRLNPRRLTLMAELTFEVSR